MFDSTKYMASMDGEEKSSVGKLKLLHNGA